MQQKFVDIGGDFYIPSGISMVLDATGEFSFSPDSLPQVLQYQDGVLVGVIVGPDSLGNSFKQTLGYTDSLLTSVSAWVKQ